MHRHPFPGTAHPSQRDWRPGHVRPPKTACLATSKKQHLRWAEVQRSCFWDSVSPGFVGQRPVSLRFPLGAGVPVTARLVPAPSCTGRLSAGPAACPAALTPSPGPGPVPQTQRCGGKGGAPAGHPGRDGTSSRLRPPALPVPLPRRPHGDKARVGEGRGK